MKRKRIPVIMGQALPPQEPDPKESSAFAAELSDDTRKVDLHDLRPDEIHHELNRTINQAFMAGEDAVKIIHGRGTGIMKERVVQYLKTNPLVQYYRTAQGTGQIGGAMIVVLEKKN
ncbi:hypothetical protein GF380_03975 [Candidatus Uhrbacteria bacterium]|nr:hypothetical protein [Candidatus Uhrbacteria bacterium]MBD3284248.1 hypothetical protein [Candidatus Uhrbacteria bacterium]